MPVPEMPEPANGEGSRGRNRNQNRDRKRKEEQDSELIAATNNVDQAGMKKPKWDSKPRWPSHTYEEIMSGPCKYHSHGTYKASHSTRSACLMTSLLKRKMKKPVMMAMQTTTTARDHHQPSQDPRLVVLVEGIRRPSQRTYVRST